MKKLSWFFILCGTLNAYAQWEIQTPVLQPRENIFLLEPEEYEKTVLAGKKHALHYPVEVTGIQLPLKPFQRFFEDRSDNPLKNLIRWVARRIENIKSLDQFQQWLGLHKYPPVSELSVFSPYHIPRQSNEGEPPHRMGFTVFQRPEGEAFSISCAECHSENLFGRPVLGLTNRFPRANQLFAKGLKIAPYATAQNFRWSTDASEDEVKLFLESRHSMRWIQAQEPIQLGLDTSLAQVSMSLAKQIHGEHFQSQGYIADSKPAVWWNVKYKNRWLSDGSVVSGNPILTNILWNEIGRGTKITDIEKWTYKNKHKIDELTAAVFATQAPHWTDYFSAEKFDLESAKRGEQLYLKTCARCHGVYQKNWSLPEPSQLKKSELLKTFRAIYNPQTPVIDVGTDPLRYLGMQKLTTLNDLKFSQVNGIKIIPQRGYVPPPLVGIWARWPYFHNNSAPSLCAVLTIGAQRPIAYVARPARNPKEDFDFECNGYPIHETFSEADEKLLGLKKQSEFFYDTRRTGMSAQGHDENIFVKNGVEILSANDKKDLIKFLQTL